MWSVWARRTSGLILIRCLHPDECLTSLPGAPDWTFACLLVLSSNSWSSHPRDRLRILAALASSALECAAVRRCECPWRSRCCATPQVSPTIAALRHGGPDL